MAEGDDDEGELEQQRGWAATAMESRGGGRCRVSESRLTRWGARESKGGGWWCGAMTETESEGD